MSKVPVSKVKAKCPYDNANIFSRLFFLWMLPLYSRGSKKKLEADDLYACPEQDEPENATNQLEKNWRQQLQKDKPSLLIALVKTFACQLSTSSAVIMFGDAVLRMAQPFMLQALVTYLEQPLDMKPDHEKYISFSTARLMASGIVITSIMLQVSRHYGLFLTATLGNKIRTAVSTMLYKKLLKMSSSSCKEADVGQILNIIANDLTRFEDLASDIHAIPLAPIITVMVIIFTYQLIRESCFVGLAVILLFMPIQAVMGRLFTRYRRATASSTDSRVRLMSEIVSAMRLIKFYCWEEPFSKLTSKIRKAEVAQIQKSYYLRGANAAFFFVTTRFMLFATLVAYVALGNKLKPEVVFTLMTFYNTLRIPLTSRLPNAIGITAESLVAVKRIENILLLEEKSDLVSQGSGEKVRASLTFNKYSGKWNKSLRETSLTDIDLKIEPGKLVVIIGSVGAGKTCLLWSILGEIHNVSGSIDLNGSASYAPQESWCFGGSVEQNIILANPMEKTRYKAVIKVCGLERDLLILPQGDQSFVGEKGHSLSGGQKARVSLARAVYNKSDYYLLDDPLSAVDPKMASHIFDNCIKGFLKDKTVLLATHQLQFIEKADLIVFMQNGRAISGTYDDLRNTCEEFLDFIDTRKKEEEESNRKKEKLRQALSLSTHSTNDSETDVESVRTESVASTVVPIEVQVQSREEEREAGSLGLMVYWNYFRSGSSLALLLTAAIVTLTSQGLNQFIDLWMSAWTDKDILVGRKKSTVNTSIISRDDTINIYIYTGLVVALFVSAFARSTLTFIIALRNSVRLHENIFIRVLRAPMLFFENNPMGRILNRFTKDIGNVDQALPNTLGELNMTVFQVLGIVVTTIVVNQWMLIPFVFILAFMIPIRNYHLRTARDLQRLDSVARSPVYSFISETFNGLATIRSFNLQKTKRIEFMKVLKTSVLTRFLVLASNRCISSILDMGACAFITSICILLMETPKGTISSGDAGVILSNSILLLGMLQNAVKQTVDIETQMVSVERILEYGKLDEEAPASIKAVDNKLPQEWPTKGEIVFDKLSIRYAPDLPLVLNNLTFTVQPGEKIGIVGRTGAGKSSIITALFRLVEHESGKILIDKVDISSLGLNKLRRGISIIPQDPSLFSGSIRKNLDPFNEYSDDKLWQALEEANLKTLVHCDPQGLEAKLTEGGSNLSVGQRQLLCLARALLKKNCILVMDEATANVDQETDEAIQSSIRKNFEPYTVLTIAHRLNTVIDMDKILVIGAGKVLEFDEPYVLLQDRQGAFYSMVKQTGSYYEKKLHRMAKNAYNEKYLERRIRDKDD